jgi:hypothetical protein
MSRIPPANLERQIADAVTPEIERRLELKSRIDELSTKELERLLSYSAPQIADSTSALNVIKWPSACE